ncbi:MarR family transcriptional regulator [Wukongibacter baidiensis]|uniref:MarR family winged helix-turn-helix transcriptional regulator n=1 Tax=Wukongibacter baidiensis TaxID=1723361 RepID=UPI003D7F1A5C
MELYEIIDKLTDKMSEMVRDEKIKLIGQEELEKISYGSFRVLEVVANSEDATISSIAKALNITKASTSVAVRKMESEGLVYKEQSSEDKRVYFIRLSEKGKAIKKGEINSLKRMGMYVESKLSEEEAKKFKEYMIKLLR